MEIPNLFTQSKEARRFYSLMLARLGMYEEFDKVLEGCSRIREYAIATVGECESLFTHSFERDAYWYLGRHIENWERHTRYEFAVFGQPLDPAALPEINLEVLCALDSRVPLHYACGQFREAAQCREIYLKYAMQKSSTDHLIAYVVNDDEIPSHPVRVTLQHAYQSQGLKVSHWTQWPAFVAGLPQSMLKAAGVSHEALLSDAELLQSVVKALTRRLRRNVSRSKRPVNPTVSPREEELLDWFPMLVSYPYPMEDEEMDCVD